MDKESLICLRKADAVLAVIGMTGSIDSDHPLVHELRDAMNEHFEPGTERDLWGDEITRKAT